MEQFSMTPASAFGAAGAVSAERITAFLRKVYGWMAIGLGVTAVVALAVAGSPALTQAIFGNRILFFALIIGEIGLVFYLSARVPKLAATPAAALFLLYPALTGATLSLVFLASPGPPIATTFVVTAGAFGALALYGTVTKRSLAGVGQFAFMGLIGVVLASIVGMFWH